MALPPKIKFIDYLLYNVLNKMIYISSQSLLNTLLGLNFEFFNWWQRHAVLARLCLEYMNLEFEEQICVSLHLFHK